MARTSVQRISLAKLINNCRDGLFAIPEIQREFVWDRKRVTNLMDSIWRQIPIGTLLLWETDSSRRHLLRHVQNVLPSYSLNNKRIWFIIDGQQRLSALYRAASGGIVTNYRRQEINFDNLCFVFDKRFEPLRFGFVKYPQKVMHIPVKDILSHEWRRYVRGVGSQKKFTDIKTFRERFKKYSIPVVNVGTSDIDEVRETFLRINSGGLRISKADRAFSRAARLNLRGLIRDLLKQLPHKFDELDDSVIQACITVFSGQRDISGVTIESVLARLEREEIENGRVSKSFIRTWTKMHKAIVIAVDYFLNELDVINRSYLPSDNMMPVLSYFFYENNLAQPSPKQRKEIRKWFWATGVAGRYSGRGYYQNIRADLEFMQYLARRKKGSFTLSEPVLKYDVKRTDYSYMGSITIAYLLMLCLKRPRYLENGAVIPLKETASISNRKDLHHVFPKAMLKRNRINTRQANSLCNICYIVAEENQSIGSRRPHDYMAELKQPKYFASVMKSHLIPYRSESGLWDKNIRRGYKKFIEQRLDWVCMEFERRAGMKLFRQE